MQRVSNFFAAVLIISVTSFVLRSPNRRIINDVKVFTPAAQADSLSLMHEARVSPSDLEVGGDLRTLPAGTTRYVTREDLLALPQIRFIATDDPNFTGSPSIEGVVLEELSRRLAANPGADLVVALCGDQYRAMYPRAYTLAHHPVLVLKVNGQPPPGWPKDIDSHSSDMGPYMISHPRFRPIFDILSHVDEQQVPWGVVRLEFHDEKSIFSDIAPRGPHAAEDAVQAGFRIAQQDCLRCHNLGEVGGLKSGVPWTHLARTAEASPKTFAGYIRDPRALNPRAQMPGSPDFDAATLAALTSYFKTFAPIPNHPLEKYTKAKP